MATLLRLDRLPRSKSAFCLAALALAVTAGVASLLTPAVGDARLGMIFLLPVLYAGVIGGLGAALICAAAAFSIDQYILAHASLEITLLGEVAALVALIVTAAVTGLLSQARRDEQARKARQVRTVDAIVDANAFFSATPSEAAVRQRLADVISLIAGAGSAVCDQDGDLIFRGGDAVEWRGATQGELVLLAGAAMRLGQVETVRLGAFRARTSRANGRIFGAAIWLSSDDDAAAEVDQYVVMLIELASAAIVRRRTSLADRKLVSASLLAAKAG